MGVLQVVFDPEVHIGRAYPVMSEQHLNRRHAEVILAAKVHFPPGWSPVESAVLTQDIAVVELQHPSRYPPVRLPEAGFKLQQDKRLRTMGWAPSGEPL